MAGLCSWTNLPCGFTFTHIDSKHFTDKVENNEPQYDLEYHSTSFQSSTWFKFCVLALSEQMKLLVGAPQVSILNKGFLQPPWHIL